MANEFQDSIFKAVDVLLEKRIENLNTDKTITATIDTCINMIDGQYLVKYQGGLMYAYSQDGAAYSKDQSVYVLVPENDLTKKKIIIGKATTVTKDNSDVFVSSVLNDYNMIGSNVITSNQNLPFGLHSYLKQDYIQLYNALDSSDNLLNVDVDALETYLKDAEAILIRGKFNTANLSKEHRKSPNGNYGIIFDFEFKDRSYNAQEGEEQPTKSVSYVLDTSRMTGNPLQYNYDITQYEVFPFDAENFVRINGIYAFSDGFVDKDDPVQVRLRGADILVSDIELFGLQEISAVFGDYMLRISTPQGSIFKESAPNNSTLDVNAEFLYKQNTSLSDKADFYWFREDARVTVGSPNYNFNGGVGWALLGSDEVGTQNKYCSVKYNNHAYENNYMCVCNYKNEVVLKAKFTLYNNTNRREITIDASPSKRFSFDRGDVTLTCHVKTKLDQDAYDDVNLYKYYWSKLGVNGSDVLFTRTEEQLAADILATTDMRTKLALQTQKQQVVGVKWSANDENLGINQLLYPVKNIESSANFKCSVYKVEKDGQEYMVGSATITIENEDAAEPTDYYIYIENGDQVFQYSESGVSPCDQRYKDPLEVLPLKCHFYDPAGLEVSWTTYSIKWKIPLEETMLVVPSAESRSENPSNGRLEWVYSQDYQFAIEDNYDYSSLNNQIEAIVIYNGVEYTKETNFLFTKVGENGTNGTDIFAKIDIPYDAENEFPFVQVVNNDWNGATWSDGKSLSQKKLSAKLYQRNIPIVDDSINTSWDMSGKGTLSKQMVIDNTGELSVQESREGSKRKFCLQIAKATMKYDETAHTIGGAELPDVNTYYAFAGVPLVVYKNSNYKVVFNKKYLLKDILYNSDGRNPMYNKNQGVFFKLYNGSSEVTDATVVWETLGGIEDLHEGADIEVISEKDAKATNDDSLSLGYSTEDGVYKVYVVPHDEYSGANTNNRVHASVPGVVDIYVPIHLSLNTFGLASLNAWDGNHIEINEDENYIMAPQIGAGIKNENNQFTGVVMGSAQTYDQEDPQVGLLGYSKGEQSIFLDSTDGSAHFGLPPVDVRVAEDFDKALAEILAKKPTQNLEEPNKPIEPPEDAEQSDKDEYARLLAEYNTQKAAFDANQKEWDNYWVEYNKVVKAQEEYEKFNGGYRYQEGRIDLIPGGESVIGNWHIGSDVLYNVVGSYTDEDGEVHKNSLGEPYSDLMKMNRTIDSQVDMYKGSIPHTQYGVQINSNPPYLSIKGKPMSDVVIYDKKDTFTWTDPATEKTEVLTNVRVPQIGSDGKVQQNKQFDINSLSGNNIIYDGDTFELELNPNASSLFTIYRHTENDDTFSATHIQDGLPILKPTGVWRREAKVGIDNAGRFYTNSIKDEGTALTLNFLPAFGVSANSVGGDMGYRGVNIEIGKTSENTVPLIKFFGETRYLNYNIETAPVYISGGSTLANEYIRPLSVHGKTVSLYASEERSIAKTTPHKMVLKSDFAVFGHYQTVKDEEGNVVPENGDGSTFVSVLELPNDKKSYTTLWAETKMRIHANTEYDHFVGTNQNSEIGKNLTATVGGNVNVDISGNVDITQPKNKYMKFRINGDEEGSSIYDFNIIPSTSSKGFVLGSATDRLYLKDYGTKLMELRATSNHIKILGSKSYIDILSKNNATAGIRLQAVRTSDDAMTDNYCGLTDIPENHATVLITPGTTSAKTGQIDLITSYGSLKVGGTKEIGTVNGAKIYGVLASPCLATDYQYIAGTFPDSNLSLVVHRDIKTLNGWLYGARFYGGAIELYTADADGNVTGSKVIDKPWLDAIQDLYYHWRDPSKGEYNYFPRTDDEIKSVISGEGYATSTDLANIRGNATSLSELKDAALAAAREVTGKTDVPSLVSAISRAFTHFYNIGSV